MLQPDLTPGEQLQDYFALCLSCHHATVASFVPTDVDTKIRGIVWRETRDLDILRPMLQLRSQSRDPGRKTASRPVPFAASAVTTASIGVRSPAGLGRLLELGDTASAEEALAAIEAEIDREQAVFDAAAAERDAELDLLRLAMTLAHNRGDLTQGMGFWKRNALTAPVMDHLSARGRFRSGGSHLSAHRSLGRRSPALSAAADQGTAPVAGHAAAA